MAAGTGARAAFSGLLGYVCRESKRSELACKDTSKSVPKSLGQHQRRRVAYARANSCGRFNRSVLAAAKRIARQRALTGYLDLGGQHSSNKKQT